MARLKEEVKAGIIVSAFLLILSVFIILIGGTRLFERHDTYYMTVKNISGLLVGAPVKIGGVKVGSVLDIKPPEFPGDMIDITFGLKKGMDLFKGTKALITQDGFVGEIHILLSLDEKSDERINPGNLIPSAEKADMTILLSKVNNISDSIDTLVKNVNTLFSQGMVDDVQEAVKKTRSLLTEIEGFVGETRGEVSGLLGDARSAINEAETMMNAIENTAKTFEKTAGTLETTASSVVDTTETVKKITDSVGEAVEFQSENVTNLLITLTETTEDLREFLQEMKNKPWSILYKEAEAKDD